MKTKESHLNLHHDLYDSAKFEQMLNEAEVLKDTSKNGKADLKIFPEFLQDTFFSLFKRTVNFKDPQEVEPVYQLNRNLIKKAMDTPEFKQLKAYTRLDEVQSATATATLGELILKENASEISELNKYLKNIEKSSKNLEILKKEWKNISQQLKSKKLTPKQAYQLKQQAKILKNKFNKQKKQKKSQSSMIQQISNSICSGSKINNTMKKTLDSVKLQDNFFGWGSDTGLFKPTSYKDRLELTHQILKNKNLLKIAKLAGRFRRLAIKKQKQKSKHSVEEISDIIQSDNISRIIPSEIFYLIDPDLEFLFLKKYTEKELLTYELSGFDTKGKGPIVVCIDVSGSMRGERDIWCKAVALALIMIAHREKRNAIVIPFDYSVQTTFEFYKNDYSIKTLLEMASFFTGGGTNYNHPLKKSMEYIEKESNLKKADIIMVTDGEGTLSDKTIAEFEELKEKLKFSLITIVIGTEYGYVQHSLKPISNFLYPIEKLNENIAGEIFESV